MVAHSVSTADSTISVDAAPRFSLTRVCFTLARHSRSPPAVLIAVLGRLDKYKWIEVQITLENPYR